MKLRLSRLLIPLFAALTLTWGPLPGHSQASAQIATPPGLNLTPAQQARAKTRQQQFVKDMTALQSAKALTPAQKDAKAKAIFQARDKDMLAILTPQQRTKVMAERAAQMKNMQAAQAFQTAHQSQIGQGQALAKKLTDSLTPAQKTQIEAVRKQFATTARPRMEKIVGNAALTPKAKQQQMMSIGREIDPKIEAILNPTQKADYVKMVQLQQQLAAEAAAEHPGK